MAYSENQVQLRKHGAAVLGDTADEPAPLRSIALWSEVNLRGRGLRRAASSAPATCAFASRISAPTRTPSRPRCSASSVSDGDAERIAREEVSPPQTLGRWQDEDAATIAALEAGAGAALRRFGYQSSSE